MMGMEISSIHYKSLYKKIQSSNQLLKRIIINIALALDLLSCNKIVHSDLKPENVLIKVKGDKL